MKRFLRHIFSIVLVFALLLPLAGLAQAVDATKITLTKTAETLYVRNEESNVTITITAEVEPKEYDGEIKWEITDGADVVSKEKEDSRSITLKAKPVTDDVSVAVQASAGAKVTSTSFIVKPDTVQPFELKLDQSSIEIGGTAKASAAAKYAGGDAAAVTYTSSDDKIATVDKNGKITGKSIGSVTITATAAGVTATQKLTVTAVTFEYTGSKGATVGQPFSLKDLYLDLARKYKDLDYDDEVTFTNVGKAELGTLYDGKTAIGNKDKCDFEDLNTVVFQPQKAGSFAFTVSVKHGDAVYSVDVKIESLTMVINLYIPVEGSEAYSFSEASANGKSASKIILNAYSAYDGFAAAGSFQFDRPDRASAKIGTLSASSKEADDVSSVKYVNAEDVGSMWFLPAKSSGTYEVDYAAYSGKDGKGTKIAEGTLSITLDAESLDVAVKLDGVKPYLFSDTKGIRDKESLDEQLVDAINSAIGKSGWTGVRFDTDRVSKASNAVGTLYKDDSSVKPSNELTSDDFVTKAELSDLYFVPDEVGSYEVAFTVHSTEASAAVLATGRLTIHVAVDLSDIAFQYVAEVDEKIKLDETDFASFVIDEFGSRTKLAYITLDSATGGGTFYDAGSKFTPDGEDKFYADGYEDAPKWASYIDDLSFLAPSKAGCTTVRFTAYGYKGNSGPSSAEGMFYIFYSDANTPAITYNVESSDTTTEAIWFSEKEFVEVYKAVTGSTAAKPQFRISILSLPTYGLLYQTDDATRSSTKLTAEGIDSTLFTVGASKSKDSVATLCYVPGRTNKTEDTAKYLAYDADNNPIYTGTIRFILSAPKKVNVTSEGLDFKASDFTDAADPITYITFAEPTLGKLYVTSGKRLIPVTEKTKLWITDSKAGDQPISETHYVPKAGQTEEVTLTYTVHTKSGSTYNQSIIVAPSSKTASTKFSDVNGVTGSWAANSVDFASKYGLVQGVGDGKFDPESSMYRRDLIIIFYRMAGSPAVTGAKPYTDIADATDSYSTEIFNSALWASKNGIMDGIVSGNEYRPTNKVTRQEYIRILYNYTKAMGISVANNGSLAGFVDADQVDTFATEAMKWAVAHSYITGMGKNDLAPKNVTRRAEIVTFLHRYLTY